MEGHVSKPIYFKYSTASQQLYRFKQILYQNLQFSVSFYTLDPEFEHLP